MVRTLTGLLLAATRAILILWLTLTLIFACLVAIKRNPVTLLLDQRVSLQAQHRLMENYGYSQGISTQYALYLKGILTGDLGTSFIHKQSVNRVLASRIPRTLWLGLWGYLGGMIVGLTLTIGMNLTRPRWSKRFSHIVFLVLLSVPSFLFGTIFLTFLGIEWELFPLVGSNPLFPQQTALWNRICLLFYHSVLPGMSLALPVGGQFAAYMHGRIQEFDHAPFVQAARGRGVGEMRILFNHKLRNTWPSLIQFMGLYLPVVACGALVIECIFGWSGMGLLLYDALMARDYPLLLGGCIWTSCFVVTGYELADYFRRRSDSPWEASR